MNNENLFMDLSNFDLRDEEEISIENTLKNTNKYSSIGTIHSLFDLQVEKNPERPAFYYDGTELTYKKVYNLSNELAYELRCKGIGRKSCVGIMMFKCPELIIGILAILNVGAAYVPIDPSYPKERIEYILKDSKAKTLLVNTTSDLQIDYCGEKVILDNLLNKERFAENIENINDPKDDAYIIYTSGSTGKPKGVVVKHDNVVPLLKWGEEILNCSASDKVLQYHSVSFDFSVWEIFLTLSTGGCLHLVSEDIAKDVTALSEYILNHEITIFNVTPSQMNYIIKYSESDGVKNLKSLRRVIFGGEILTPKLVENCFNVLSDDCILYNGYGPTETTVFACFYAIEKSDLYKYKNLISVPIGKAAANTRLFVMDEHMAPCGVNARGELYIGGSGVSAGYLNDEEKTSKSFLHINGETLYRTNDMVKINEHGDLVFLGREDSQVKVRGYRIEVEEIESILRSYSKLQSAAVIAREDVDGGHQLHSLFVEKPGIVVTVEEIKEFLSLKLPQYMIPAYFYKANCVPLMVNGKVDRKMAEVMIGALTPMDFENYAEPYNETQKEVLEVWKEIFKHKNIGIKDNFYSLGGDSIIAIQLASKLNLKGLSVKPSHIFMYQTIEELSVYIVNTKPLEIAPEEIESGQVSLTPIQKWFFRQDFENPDYFHQTVELKVDEDIDVVSLEKALNIVIKTHSMLRARFIVDDFTVEQYIDKDKIVFSTNFYDLTQDKNTKEAVKSISIELKESIDITAAPLMKFGVLKLGDNSFRLIWVIHHLLVDGVSWRILLEDLISAYKQIKLNGEVVLQKTSTSYIKWTDKLKSIASSSEINEEFDYWNKYCTLLTSIPRDNPKGSNKQIFCQEVKFTLDKESTSALMGQANRAFNTSAQELMLVAIFRSLNKWNNERPIITLEGHGRDDSAEEINLTRTVGWFTDIFPFSADVKFNESLKDSIINLKEEFRSIPSQGKNFSTFRYMSPNKKIRNAFKSYKEPEISFNYLGQLDVEKNNNNWDMMESSSINSAEDNNRLNVIEITAFVVAGKLVINMYYSKDIHYETTAKCLMSNIILELKAVIKICTTNNFGCYTPTDFPLLSISNAEAELIPSTTQDAYPLSSMQQGMLFHTIYNEDSPLYHVQMHYILSGDLNLKLMNKAFNSCFKRHQVLRTIFLNEGFSNAIQVVLKNVEFNIEFENSCSKENVDNYKEFDRSNGFKLNIWPLMRAKVFEFKENSYEMVFSFHHILLDGWSCANMMGEILKYYNSLYSSPEEILVLNKPETEYKDFIKYQLKNWKDDSAKRFWSEKLKGATETKFPRDFKIPNSRERKFVSKTINFMLAEEMSEKLRIYAKGMHFTMNEVVSSAFAYLLASISRENTVTFGTVVSGRPADLANCESTIGCFLNTIPLYVEVKADWTFSELISSVREYLLSARDYEGLPLSEILQGTQGLDFNALLAYENYPKTIEVKCALKVDDFKAVEMTNYDITAAVADGENLVVKFMYPIDLYNEHSVMNYGKQFIYILEQVAVNFDTKLKDIQMVLPEHREILNGLAFSENKYSNDKTLQRIFMDQAQRTPNKEAVTFENSSVTYKELDDYSTSVAIKLRDIGIKRNSLVGILMVKSIEMIVGLLAILKSGGAYVPIDPNYPNERQAYMMNDAAMEVILSDDGFIASHKELLHSIKGLKHIVPVDINELLVKEEILDNVNLPEDLAYVIYTSGSTGKPKGTLVEHRNIVSLLLWGKDTCKFTSKDRIVQYHSFSFDFSVWEIFEALISGGSIHLVPDDVAKNIGELVTFIYEKDITTFNVTPSQLNYIAQFVENQEVNYLSKLRLLIVGGEVLPIRIVERCRKLLSDEVEIYNGYGPTETTVFASFYKVIPEKLETLKTLPIGANVSNGTLYVLDNNLNQCDINQPGELYIGGSGVCRGYLNNNEKTENNFLRDNFNNTSYDKMYKSGDIVKVLSDGNIEYLGRADNQVKLRGYRVELGEIESVLLTYPEIEAAAVIVKKYENNDDMLCCYFTSKIENVNVRSIKEHLSVKLPHFMIPAQFYQLDNMPMSHNGKVNRNKLQVITIDRTSDISNNYNEPSTEMETVLKEIWKEVLKQEIVNTDDNFFDLGGHSLLAMQVYSRIKYNIASGVKLTDIFTYPTIKELALRLDDLNSELVKVQSIIQSAPKMEYYELSNAQKRLWFLYKLNPLTPAYNVPSEMLIKGRIDEGVFCDTINQLANRHEILKMDFFEKEGKPFQKYSKNFNFKNGFYDYVSLEKCVAYNRIDDLVKIDKAQPFNLEGAPLFRIILFKLTEDEYYLYVNMHHIICDGWSLGIFINDFTEIYRDSINANYNKLPKLKLQYIDFAYWQNEKLNSGGYEEDESYWLNKFSGELPNLDLPCDYRVSEKGFKGASLNTELSEEVTLNLKKFCRREEISLFSVLISAYGMVLSKLCGSYDMVIGTPAAARNIKELEALIGFFINTLPIRLTFDKDTSLYSNIRKINKSILEDLEHQEYPFDMLIERLNSTGSVDNRNIFNTMFVLQNAPLNLEVSEFEIIPIEKENKTTKFDLNLNAVEKEDKVLITLDYSTELFKKDTAESILQKFEMMINLLIKSPETKLSQVEALTSIDYSTLLSLSNNNKQKKGETIVESFLDRVKEGSSRTAIIYKDENWDYERLNKESCRIANCLSEKGVEKGDFVVIMMEKAPELIAALLGVLRLGAAYVPIDPNYPKARISYILKDCAAKALITDSKYSKMFDEAQIITKEHWKNFSDFHKENIVNFENLAYMIYTSGSTGMPKGVMVTHGSLENYTSWVKDEFKVTPEDRFALLTSFAFDLTVTSCIVPLISGGSLSIVSEDISLDSYELLAHIEKNNVSIVKFTPAHFGQLLDASCKLNCTLSNLRLVILGGEALNAQHVREWLDIYKHQVIVNEYGPTEATVATIFQNVDKNNIGQYNDYIPIGKPIYNTDIYILDDDMNRVPRNVRGEICIAGASLALGYINQEEKTKSVFVLNPFGDGRLYKTGDIGKVGIDGLIYYLGRKDDQVKVRGYRIELGEIENILKQNPEIKEAAVIIKKDSQGNNVLKAFVSINKKVEETNFKDYLKTYLPEYMVPASIIILEEMPLTVNDKVDRKALLIHTEEIKITSRLPTTETEIKLADIWKESLGMKLIGAENNFFELGGHSLLAMQLYSRMKETWSVSLKLMDIFEKPILEDLAQYIDELQKLAKPQLFRKIEKQETLELYPLSNAQKRIWFFQKLDAMSTVYNMPMVFRVRGNLNIEALERAINMEVLRQGSFSTVFVEREGAPYQKILSGVTFKINVIKTLESEAVSIIVDDMLKPFELDKAPLIRISIYEVGNSEWILYFNMHHIISDGWSMEILVKDIKSLYNQILKGEVVKEEQEIQYVDYAVWQQMELKSEGMKKQKEFWLKSLQAPLPVLNLPYNYERPEVQSFAGSHFSFKIDKMLTDRIKKFALQKQQTIFMVLIGGYSAFLHGITGDRDIIIGTPSAGRKIRSLTEIVGVFVNTLALRFKFDEKICFNDFLDQVKSVVINGLNNEDYPFDLLIEEIDVDRNLGRTPLFSTVFTLQQATEKLETDEIEFIPIEFENNISKFDLTLGADIGEVLSFKFEYNSQLFMHSTIETFAEQFIKVLDEMTKEPATGIQSVSLLTYNQLQVVEDMNDTSRFFENKTLDKLYDEACNKFGSNIALSFKNERLTYNELKERTDKLCKVLSKQGVGHGDVVAVVMERSTLPIIALLAIIKCGACYLSIDTSYPWDRIKYMLLDSGSKLIITEQKFANNYNELPLITLCIDQALSDNEVIGEVNIKLNLDDPAYIIYTSGSTGLPKGTLLSHRGVVNLVNWADKELNYSDTDICLQFNSLSFDVSVYEIFSALLLGCQLHIIPTEKKKLLNEVLKEIFNNDVNIIFLPTAYFNAMSQYISKDNKNSLSKVKLLIIGGEAMQHDYLNMWKEKMGEEIHLINAYGPTEATVLCTYYHITEELEEDLTNIPIGQPIDNTKIYLLNDELSMTPINSVGEICIEGDGVAIGYIGDVEKAKKAFIKSPFNEDKMLYKTGDLGRRLPEGMLQYEGRRDFQVKIRGFRIELGEIETTLRTVDGIAKAIVIARKDNRDSYYLAAYYTLNSPETKLDVEEIKKALTLKLPDYSIPNYYFKLKVMPINANGKIDRKILKNMDVQDAELPTEVEELPVTETEKVIAEVWKDSLRLKKINRRANFFSIGGESIISLQVISKLNEKGYKLKPGDIFKYQTLYEIANYADEIAIEVPEVIDIKDEPKLPYGMSALYDFDASSYELREEEFNVKDVSTENLRQLVMDNEVLRTWIYINKKVVKAEVLKYEESTAEDEVAITIEHTVGAKKCVKLADMKISSKGKVRICYAYPLVSQFKIDCLLSELNSMQNDRNLELKPLDIDFKFSPKLDNRSITSYGLSPSQKIFLYGSNVKFIGRRQTHFHLRLEENKTMSDVASSINEVIKRHGVLRSKLINTEDGLKTFEFNVNDESEIPCINLVGLSVKTKESLVSRCIKNMYSEFKIIDNLLHRPIIIQEECNVFSIIWIFNHLISDAQNTNLICGDLTELLKQNNLKEIQSNYKNYVEDMDSMLKKINLESFYDYFNNYMKMVKDLRTRVNRFTLGEIFKSELTWNINEIAEVIDIKEYSIKNIIYTVLCKSISQLLNIDEIPFNILYHGRYYSGKNYFDLAGDFHDVVPVTFKIDQGEILVRKMEETLNKINYENINYSALIVEMLKNNTDLKIDVFSDSSPITINFIQSDVSSSFKETNKNHIKRMDSFNSVIAESSDSFSFFINIIQDSGKIDVTIITNAKELDENYSISKLVDNNMKEIIQALDRRGEIKNG